MDAHALTIKTVPGLPPLYGRGTPSPPVGSRGLAAAPPPAVMPETLKHPAVSPSR